LSSYKKSYSYLSGYVHGDALSLTQIAQALTDEEKSLYIRLAIANMMMILSLVIVNYAKKFPPAKTICDSDPSLYKSIQIIVNQASSMK
ncbi:MAG: hypothetical protein SGI73_20760, partial [Chloroflexota bacterium]|nr:hypothetical protein [Chloroflexota bacterium]